MKLNYNVLWFSAVFILCVCSCKQIRYTTTASGLQYKILKEGTGVEAADGTEVLIHERMYYQNDSLLFDSYTLPGPVKVLVGGHQAIAGLDEALHGMKEGEIKELIVPPVLSKRSGNINFPHPDSTLIYKVELVKILND